LGEITFRAAYLLERQGSIGLVMLEKRGVDVFTFGFAGLVNWVSRYWE